MTEHLENRISASYGVRVSSFQVNVQVLEDFAGLVSDQCLRQVAEDTLAAECHDSESKVSIVIADDDVVRGLNRRHRGLDENTDVLAFSFIYNREYHEEGESVSRPSDRIDFVLPPGHRKSIGEVVISYPQAQRQARRFKHSTERELALLVAHGVLHLLGHDHAIPEEEEIMKRIETQVLDRVLRKT